MNLTKIWLNLFGTTSFLGINLGFWAGMAVVLFIVILMNIVFWHMKPKNSGQQQDNSLKKENNPKSNQDL